MNHIDFLYPLRVLKQILKMPKTAHHQQILDKKVDKLEAILNQNNGLLRDIVIDLDTIDKKNNYLDSELNNISALIRSDAIIVNNSPSDNHLIDGFYKNFEDKFRGKEEDIKNRIASYNSLFIDRSKNLKSLPILDLGCGRGEFLLYARENNIKAVGVDINHAMIKYVKSRGFEVYEVDALSYLSKQKRNSLSGVVGFHIVEHLPFSALVKLSQECFRTVAKEGFVLFETPNPGNLIVGAKNFYMDPSHIRPLPAELLSFVLREAGFKTEIIYKHPVRETIKHTDQDVESLMKLVYGPRDYAILAKK
ncbi:MAG: class I SAM-dependent methyltransferase [Candidatus Saccharimonadales bacterium]